MNLDDLMIVHLASITEYTDLIKYMNNVCCLLLFTNCYLQTEKWTNYSSILYTWDQWALLRTISHQQIS